MPGQGPGPRATQARSEKPRNTTADSKTPSRTELVPSGESISTTDPMRASRPLNQVARRSWPRRAERNMTAATATRDSRSSADNQRPRTIASMAPSEVTSMAMAAPATMNFARRSSSLATAGRIWGIVVNTPSLPVFTRASSGPASSAELDGSRNEKRAPCPGVPSARMSPPWRSMMLRTLARPMPCPSNCSWLCSLPNGPNRRLAGQFHATPLSWMKQRPSASQPMCTSGRGQWQLENKAFPPVLQHQSDRRPITPDGWQRTHLQSTRPTRGSTADLLDHLGGELLQVFRPPRGTTPPGLPGHG